MNLSIPTPHVSLTQNTTHPIYCDPLYSIVQPTFNAGAYLWGSTRGGVDLANHFLYQSNSSLWVQHKFKQIDQTTLEKTGGFWGIRDIAALTYYYGSHLLKIPSYIKFAVTFPRNLVEDLLVRTHLLSVLLLPRIFFTGELPARRYVIGSTMQYPTASSVISTVISKAMDLASTLPYPYYRLSASMSYKAYCYFGSTVMSLGRLFLSHKKRSLIALTAGVGALSLPFIYDENCQTFHSEQKKSNPLAVAKQLNMAYHNMVASSESLSENLRTVYLEEKGRFFESDPAYLEEIQRIEYQYLKGALIQRSADSQGSFSIELASILLEVFGYNELLEQDQAFFTESLHCNRELNGRVTQPNFMKPIFSDVTQLEEEATTPEDFENKIKLSQEALRLFSKLEFYVSEQLKKDSTFSLEKDKEALLASCEGFQ